MMGANPIPEAIEQAKAARLAFEADQIRTLIQRLSDETLERGPVKLTRYVLGDFTYRVREVIRALGLERTWHADVTLDHGNLDIRLTHAPDPFFDEMGDRLIAAEKRAEVLHAKLIEVRALVSTLAEDEE